MQFFHFLTYLLTLASAAAAFPLTGNAVTENAITKRQSTCNSQEWNIQQYIAFTAGSTSPAGGPPAFGYSHISFLFTDPNFNIQYSCSASANKGQPLESLIGNSYPCDGGNMSFQYFGSTIELQRTGVKCGDVTYTESGSTSSLSLDCYDIFGGQKCETVTQTNVPIAFLTQTGGGK